MCRCIAEEASLINIESPSSHDELIYRYSGVKQLAITLPVGEIAPNIDLRQAEQQSY
jgi:hypothetical protein